MVNKKPNILTNYLMNLCYQIIAIIVPLITTPYVSRILHADGIGAYSYTLSVTTYFSLFATLGVATYGQLVIAKLRNEISERSKTFWGIVAARICTTVLVVVVYLVAKPFLGTYPDLYVLMIINLVASALDISWFFQGLEQFKITVVRNLIVRIICTICIFIFVKTEDDLLIYAFIIQGSTLVGNCLLWPNLKKRIIIVPIRSIRIMSHWKQSIMYFIPTLATSVYTILDKSMIGWLTQSAFENGYYEQAHKIEQILVLVVTSLGTVTLPRMAYLFYDGNTKAIHRIVNTTVNFILIVSLPMAFGVIAVAPNLIPLFLGDGYEPCIRLLQIFAFLIIIVGLDNIIGKQCLMASGMQKKYNIGVIAGACVNFFINLFMIPKMGSLGAAIASVIAEFIILCVFIYYSKDMINIKSMLALFIKYLLLATIMVIAVTLTGKTLSMNWFTIGIQVVVGMVVYCFLLLLSRDKFIIGFCKSLTGKNNNIYGK